MEDTKHSDVAGFLIKTDNHNRVSELGAVVDAVTFIAFHIITAGADSENIGATVGVGFEWFIVFAEEIENVTLTTSDFSKDVVAPNDEPDNCCNEK